MAKYKYFKDVKEASDTSYQELQKEDLKKLAERAKIMVDTVNKQYKTMKKADVNTPAKKYMDKKHPEGLKLGKWQKMDPKQQRNHLMHIASEAKKYYETETGSVSKFKEFQSNILRNIYKETHPDIPDSKIPKFRLTLEESKQLWDTIEKLREEFPMETVNEDSNRYIARVLEYMIEKKKLSGRKTKKDFYNDVLEDIRTKYEKLQRLYNQLPENFKQ